MGISEADVQKAVRRLHNANSRLLKKHPFYAILLVQMKFSFDINCNTAYTDATRIAFNPAFLENLNDTELDFVLMHEILHVALSHCTRTKQDYDKELFNIACDIVVNSNILYSNNMDISTITLKDSGVSMHLLPDGSEGYLYSAEEVYKILKDLEHKTKSTSKSSNKEENSIKTKSEITKDKRSFDTHEKWPTENKNITEEELDELQEKWQSKMLNAGETVSQIKDNSKRCGNIPLGIERVISELKNPQMDWRTLLHDFVQEEINDYSFMPPDKRMQECDFFLPDFNEKTEKVDNILFMVDTSGSMSDDTISECYSEIKGSIEQFDGRLSGYLGFFDARVVPPVRFSDMQELEIIRPYGGGGTSFKCIFDYIRKNMSEALPVSIVILTDGYAPFPDEKEACGIPVLWICTTDQEIPWGKIARIKSDCEQNLHC